MTKKSLIDLIDAAQKLPQDAWLNQLEDLAEDRGYFEPLGPDHSALFIDDGPMLLVTFETIATVRSGSQVDVPYGWELASGQDYSQLCLLSHDDTWFRHRAVYGFFDKLVDEGFFDQYDRVVFYGAEACGYAAAAYSVAAPGATVILAQPQATLDPRVTEWDNRFRKMRKTSFTNRYGYAPDMIEAADRAFVLYDPAETLDAMHAALFDRSNVTKIRCRHIGAQVELYLRRMGILRTLITIAFERDLTALDLHRALRERRSYLPYLRGFLNDLEKNQRPYLTALMCRSVLGRMNTPRFQSLFTRSVNELKIKGLSLPQPKAHERA